MASPFQKYQGEQVQQMAPGFVEAYGRAGQAIGAGIANIGAGIGSAIEEASREKKEEAKLRASIAVYMKADPKVKAVELALQTGELEKNEDGTVGIRPDLAELMTPEAQAAIDFYNQTGGDGSKLTGDGLIEFATRFQAQKAYDAEQAASEDAKLERLKKKAEIDKIYADAYSKTLAGVRAGITASFASGQDVSGVAVPPPPVPPSIGGADRPSVPPLLFPAQQLSAPQTLVPTTPARYSGLPRPQPAPGATAEAPLKPQATASVTAETLGKTPVPAPAKPPAIKAQAPTPVTMVSLPGQPQGKPLRGVIEELGETPFVRTAATVRYNEKVKNIDAQHSMAMSRLAALGADATEIKNQQAIYEFKVKSAKEAYDVEIADIDNRVAASKGVAEETRAVAAERRAVAGEGRAVAAEGRAVVTAEQQAAAAERAATEFGVTYGTTRQGQPSQKAKPGTFAAKVQNFVESRSTIRDTQGRPLVGGQKQIELADKAREIVQKKLTDYPAWWPSGIVSRGGVEYQYEMKDDVTGKPLNPSVAAKVNDSIEGYAEAREYLVTLYDAIEAKDESRVKEFMNRFLLLTDTDKEYFTGEQLTQFGVAAFRKGFVSGGNFSDKDREFVQDALVKLNSINPIQDKSKFMAAAQSLAKFLDDKFRAPMAAQEIYVDVPTSKKFLEREGRTQELDQLKRTERYYQVFKISPSPSGKETGTRITDDPAALRAKAEELKDTNPAASAAYLRTAEEIERRNTAKPKAR